MICGQFETKAEATRFLSAVLASGVIDASIEAVLHELVARHPDADEKIGVGIERFSVGDVGEYKSRCFFIHRLDGTRIDFSFRKALDGELPYERKFASAARKAVRAYMTSVKTVLLARTPILCPESMVPLTADNSEVDHKAPHTFKACLDEFINSLKPAVQEFTARNGYEFKDPKTRDTFNAFHQHYCEYHSCLRLVEKSAHRKLKRKI